MCFRGGCERFQLEKSATLSDEQGKYIKGQPRTVLVLCYHSLTDFYHVHNLEVFFAQSWKRYCEFGGSFVMGELRALPVSFSIPGWNLMRSGDMTVYRTI